MKTCHRLSLAALTWALVGLPGLALVADLAHAASTTISDVPLAAAKRPNPNLIMAIDDSGSMDFELGTNANDGAVWWNVQDARFHGRTQTDCSDFVSKSWGGTGTIDYNPTGEPDSQKSKCPTDASGTSYTWMKYGYLFPNGTCGQSSPSIPKPPCDARNFADEAVNHFAIAPTQQFAYFRSSAYNRVYYNPAITYLPWKAYNDGTSSCPSGASASGVCTPGNASTSSTLSHPVYGSSSSASSMDLFSLYTGLDSSSNPQDNFTFRMFAGMIVPAGAKYRLCKGSACGGWLNASSKKNACLTNSSITSCASNMGMSVGSESSGKIDMTSKPGGYAVDKPYDYADVAITYTPATYWVPSTCTFGSGLADNLDSGVCAYGPDGLLITKVDLKVAAGPFTVPAGRTDCAGGTSCTLAEERQNLANWFQYYRKRHLMVNGALGNAYDGLQGLRAGFFLFNNRANVTMYNFDSGSSATNSTRLIGALYQNTGASGTPTRNAVDYIGQQFRRTDSAAPITNYCQFNAGFVITDGFATPGGPAVTPGNYDGQTPAATAYQYNKQFNTNAATVITAPYADTFSNTMGDMAMKMYTENPRPDLTPVGKVPVDKSDVSPGADRNPNLHVNTYGMILNLTGRIFGNTSTTQLTNQNNDPYTYPPDWSNAPLGDTTVLNRDASAIDELWHATINGRGQMLLATSPEATRDAVLTVVANVVSKGGAAAAVAVSNPNPVPGDNFAYASSYNSGSWSGDINAFALDLTTGQPSDVPVWNPSPQHLLANRNLSTNPRIIATYSGTTGTAFEWTGTSTLTTAQKASLSNDPDVLAFLRGDRSKEGSKFRGRGPRAPYPNNIVPDNVAVLGDIVNAEPIFISAPRFGYVDSGYAAFKSGAAATRTKMVYQGANDGMLHAFNATDGTEVWAYVPNAMFPTLLNLSSKNAFVHKFYVDGTPVSGDVDFSNTSGSSATTPDWRTILVGGYAKGGRGYYALDVTNPTVADEAALAGKVLWEFPNTATAADTTNMGYSFGRPIVVKTRAAGWVVLVTSGYNNGNSAGDSGGGGQGHLFVLNAKNGTRLADLNTRNGGPGVPSGLAYISAWVDHANTDNTVESVYGGDLTGSVWRFDLSGATVESWNVQLLAKLSDGAPGNAQPVTTEPELGLVSRKRMIYVGTGEYLGTPDIPGTGALASATSTQTMYALRDPFTTNSATPRTTALITPLRTSLTAQVATNDATTGNVSLTTNAVDLTTKSGWYVDLPVSGERVVTNPALGQGVLTFTTNIPDGTDPCLPGGSSKDYTVNYATGGYIANSTATGNVAGKPLGSTLASRVQLIKLPTGAVVGLIRQSDASTTTIQLPRLTVAPVGKRKSWREINIQ